MTLSNNIYQAEENQGLHPLEQFYKNNNCSTKEQKVEALQRQLRQHPNHRLSIDERLSRLETDFYKLFHRENQERADSRASRDKWKHQYQQVNDDNNSVLGDMSPIDSAILRGAIQIEREDGTNILDR